MSIIEKASKVIVSRTSTTLDLDKDQQEILEYGALSLLQTLISIVLLTLFGMLFHTLLEILVISMVMDSNRRASNTFYVAN